MGFHNKRNYQMTPSEIISVIALGLSVISISVSIYNVLRDRAYLLIDSQFYGAWEGDQPYIHISIRNSGRRPVIIRMWACVDDDGNWVGKLLGKDHQGIRLGETEWYEFDFHIEDLYQETPDYDVNVTDLWVEDSLGRRYKIKNARKNIRQLIHSIPHGEG